MSFTTNASPSSLCRPMPQTMACREDSRGLRLLHAQRQSLRQQSARTPNQFVADITDEALYADELGMHSAWIGEHHFNSLGVLSCPDLVLAYIAARTQAHPPRARPSPCCRCTIRSASPSSGRRSICSATAASISPPAAATTGANTCRSTSRSRTTRASSRRASELVRRLWAADGPHLASRQALLVRRRADHAEAGAAADPDLRRARSPSRRSSWRRGSAAG